MTLCLQAALSRHDLIDDIPAVLDVAVPRGTWTPTTRTPVRWRYFDTDTFDVGRRPYDLGSGFNIGIYSPERNIVDAFRLRHLDGANMANEALKRWLRQGGQPSELLRVARSFPQTEKGLREMMAILL